jgi:TP901 family phage tail tape measure protein
VTARTVVVKLVANVADFRRGMADAAASAKRAQDDFGKFTQKNRADMEEVGKAGLALGTGLAIGVGLALKKFADFDQAMSNVQAATHSSAAEMSNLREAALEAGERTVFSATEAADAIEQLAKAGVATADILNGGLNGALDLAAAGGLEVGAAAEVAATAMTQFSLAGSEIPHVADLLAAAAGKAQGDVSDMGMALKQAGLVASQTGLSIEETTAGLASFAAAGLLGSDAGTSFKSMLQRLTPQSAEAEGKMRELGISAYDAQGNFVGLEAFAGNLQDSLAGLTVEQRNSAMATIFGSDAVRAASVLYSQGAEGVAAWTDKVNDAGYAQETAAIKLDNLKGDIEAFLGSVETALIRTGEAGDGPARKLVQQATDIVNSYNTLPSSAQGVVLAVGTVGAAASLAAGGFLVLAPRIVATQTALAALATQAPRTAAAMTTLAKSLGIGAVLAGAAIGVGQLVDALADAPPGVGALTDALADFAQQGKLSGDLAKVVGQDFDELGKKLEAAGRKKWLDFSNDEYGGAVKIQEVRDEIEALDQALAGLVNSGNGVLAARFLMDAGVSAEDAAKHFDAYKEAQAATSAQTKLTAQSQDGMAGAVDDATGAIVEQSDSLGDLIEKVRALSDQVLGLRGSSRSYEAALDDATKALKENGKTLDITSEKGRANEAALDAIASAAGDVLESMVASGKPISDVTAKFEQQRGALVNAAMSFGMTREAAEAYADSVLRIPDKQTTTIALTGVDAALAQVQRLRDYLAGLTNKTVTVRVDQVLGTTVQRGLPGRVVEKASGGYVSGPGTGTSDSIPALLSNGEYVIRAASVAKVGVAALDRINRYAAGGLVRGYASGGAVSASDPRSLTSATRGLTDLAAIRAHVQAWADYNRQLEQAARKRELVADAQQADRELAAAKGTEDRARAQERLNEANQAVRDFDYAVAREREAAAVERQVAALEAQAQAEEKIAAANRAANELRRQRQDNKHELGLLSDEAYLEILQRRMDDEVRYSDAWMALWRERERILDQQAQAEQDLTDELKAQYQERVGAAQKAVDDSARAQEQGFDRLNNLLDQEAAIRDRMAESEQRHHKTVADLRGQMATREAEFYTASAAARGDYEKRIARIDASSLEQMNRAADTFAAARQRIALEQRQAVDARRQELFSWASLTEVAGSTWGNTAEQLIDNARKQAEQFTQWMEALAFARRRGLSEQVIGALGLDKGPQALSQLQQLNDATENEIASLNAAVVQRTAQASEQVSREQALGFADMTAALAEAQRAYADEVAVIQAEHAAATAEALDQYTQAALDLQRRYETDQATLAARLAEAQAEFTQAQTDMVAQLAAIGQDQGRSYADALAAGINSGIPGIQAAAAAAVAATAALAEANKQLAAEQAAGISAPPTGTAALAPSPFKRNGRIRTATYDVGGWLMPGYTLAYNGTGQAERVVTASGSGPSGQVLVESHTYVVLDGQVIDHRVETKLGRQKDAALIAGSR